MAVIGDMIIVDDDDERLSLTTSGFKAEVIPEDSEDEWRTLGGADELVEFYDPTDVFGDLADALAEAFPAVAPGAGRCRDQRHGRGRGRRRTRPSAEAARRRRRRRGRTDRVTMRLAAAELVESREILPGQWLQAYHAPALASGSRAGQFVHARPGRLLRDDPAPAVLAQHGRCRAPAS